MCTHRATLIHDICLIENSIRALDVTTSRIDQDGAEEAHFFDGVRHLLNLDVIANIKRMLDEEEDNATKN